MVSLRDLWVNFDMALIRDFTAFKCQKSSNTSVFMLAMMAMIYDIPIWRCWLKASTQAAATPVESSILASTKLSPQWSKGVLREENLVLGKLDENWKKNWALIVGLLEREYDQESNNNHILQVILKIKNTLTVSIILEIEVLQC